MSTQPASEPAVELDPLLGEEPAVLDIGFRASEVDLAVRGVEIPDHEHWTSAPQLLRPVEHSPIEVEFVADPAVVQVLPASLGKIAVYNREPPAIGPEVSSDEPALNIEPRLSERGLH